MKKIIYLSFLMLIFSCINVAWANDGTNPVDLLQSISNKMISNLKANKASLKTNPSLVYSLAFKIVVPYADLDEMAKRVLPPEAWKKATGAERSQFESEFTTLLVRTYSQALADYTDQTVRFYPVRGGYRGRNTVKVDSQLIRSDGPALSMNYSLILRGSQWKLYDMTVEGVSLLESFRSQFSDKLSRGNIADLIRDLKQHNARH